MGRISEISHTESEMEAGVTCTLLGFAEHCLDIPYMEVNWTYQERSLFSIVKQATAKSGNGMQSPPPPEESCIVWLTTDMCWRCEELAI
jgi:hypothetical protein